MQNANSNRTCWRPVFVSAALLFLAGCGSDGPVRVPLSGTVTLDGTPVTEGHMSIVPVNSGVASSAEINGGEFEVTAARGPQLGDYKFRLTLPQEKAMVDPQAPQPDTIYETTATVEDSDAPLELAFQTASD